MDKSYTETARLYREVLRKFNRAIKAGENTLFNILIPRPGECSEDYEHALKRINAKIEELAECVLLMSVTAAQQGLQVDKKAMFLANRIVMTSCSD